MYSDDDIKALTIEAFQLCNELQHGDGVPKDIIVTSAAGVEWPHVKQLSSMSIPDDRDRNGLCNPARFVIHVPNGDGLYALKLNWCRRLWRCAMAVDEPKNGGPGKRAPSFIRTTALCSGLRVGLFAPLSAAVRASRVSDLVPPYPPLLVPH